MKAIGRAVVAVGEKTYLDKSDMTLETSILASLRAAIR